MATRFGDRSCVDPAALARDCQDQGLPLDWWGRANLFRNPLGRGPGAGAVLLTKADLDAIDTTTDHSLVFEDDRRPNAPITLRRITLLRAQCVTPGHRDDARAVYLCEIVDRRYFLGLVPVDRAYNVRNADGDDYLSETLNGSAAFTWQEVIDYLTDTLSLDPLTLPFTPDGTPENLRYHAGWAWEALNDVLDRLACAVKYDPVADTFTLVRLGDSATAAAVALSTELGTADRDGMRVWDKYHVEPNRGRLPEKVRVLFPRRPVPTDGSSPWYAEDVTLTATTGVAAGTFVQLRDDLTAIGSGTPTNAAALTTRAAERAADWRRKRIWYEKRVTLVYRDFRPAMVPGETMEQTALDDHGGPMTTVLESGPDGAMEGFSPWAPPLGTATNAEGNPSGCTPPGIDTSECLQFTVSAGAGRCADIAAATVLASLSGGWWVASDPITTAAGDGTISYRVGTTGYPEMKITVGVTDYYGTPAGCDASDRPRFAFGGSTLCDGTVSTETCANGFAVAVGCVPCGYDECTGWYCDDATGVVYYAANCAAYDLLEAVFGGGGTVTEPPCADAPAMVRIDLSSSSPCIGSRSGVAARTGVGPYAYAALDLSDCGLDTPQVNVTCTGDSWAANFDGGRGFTLVAASTTPFGLVFQYTGVNAGPFPGPYTTTVTVTAVT